jgi:hypothetical protein
MPVMRVTAQVSIFLLIGLIAAPSVHAFGSEGHLLVGAVAERHLCADARKETDRLLQGESLGQAGRWPDWIRSEPEWRHTRTWHYINVGDHEPIERVTGAGQENVLWAIDRFERQLGDPALSDQERATALRFLAHFAADVHQPLHVGRAEDRGGNSIPVLVGDRRTNLHAFWDAQDLLKGAYKGRELTRDQYIGALGLLTRDRVDTLQADSPLVWARESQARRGLVYDFEPAKGGSAVPLDADYRARAADIVDLRLAEAGVRLAGRLNRIFCSSGDAR